MRFKITVLLAASSAVFQAANAAPAFSPATEEMRRTLTSTQLQTQTEALSAFRAHRYSAAFGRFAELADTGHVPSAEMAILMLRYGSALFGSDWTASASQQARWQALVINSARTRVLTFDSSNSD